MKAFTITDYMSTFNELHETCLLSQFSVFKISKLKAINNNKSFYRLTLILSGGISLNPSHAYNHHDIKNKYNVAMDPQD